MAASFAQSGMRPQYETYSAPPVVLTTDKNLLRRRDGVPWWPEFNSFPVVEGGEDLIDG
jgi:hypothetical protein